MMINKKYPFKFSCIMAIYNVEEYIEKAIQSIIKQSIGFKKNVQLILVNDGSPDNSGAICDRYASLYPKNILVIHKENGGVSSARNAGLIEATGEYVNFIDPDDMFSKNTLSSVNIFFKKHKSKTNVVCVPMMFFEGDRGPHMLNTKFENGSRVIDLRKEPNAILLSTSSSFIVSEFIKEKLFDTELSTAEDFKRMYELFLDNPYLGVVCNPVYHYRKRISSSTSAIQGRLKNKASYTKQFKKVYLYLIELYKNNLGYVPNFLQNAIMYDIQWYLKIKDITEEVLSNFEKKEFLTILKATLKYIDEDIILAQKHIAIEYKLHALQLKHKKEYYIRELDRDFELCYGNFCFSTVSESEINFATIEKQQNMLLIHGMYKCFKPTELQYNIAFKVNNTYYEPSILDTKEDSFSLEVATALINVFRIAIPLTEETTDLSVFIKYSDVLIPVRNIYFWPRFPLNDKFHSAYCVLNNFLFSFINNAFKIEKLSFFSSIIKECRFLLECITKYPQYAIKIVPIRLIYQLANIFKNKKIILLSDRVNIAGDNGEAMFQYIQKQGTQNIKPYFILHKDSKDFTRLKKIGPIVPYMSIKHRLLHLLADALISSHADEHVLYPFDKRIYGFKDIVSVKPFIFLQHGITKDDISKWLNKLHKNITIFICSTKNEQISIIDGAYFYSEKEVCLTGFPRFDSLKDDSNQKVITIMPTWRKYIFDYIDDKSGQWINRQNFKQSDYYIFFNSLINNERLIETCKKYNYILQFFPHPNILPYSYLFNKNSIVKFNTSETKYRDIYRHSSLIVTDYSSAVFDFAYLYKPIIYTQFDIKTFFKGEHVYTKGYFDYERDGFGEVRYELESTVDTLIDYIKDGCKLKDKYKKRIDNFFAFRDKNNCNRVYKKIIKTLNIQEKL